MAWGANGLLFTATIRDSLKNGIALNIGGGSPDSLKIALYGATVTTQVAVDTDPATYATTNECTGTNWAAGGTALVSPAVTIGTGGNAGALLIAANNVSVASTTIATGVYGGIIYDDTLSPKCQIAAIPFAGSPYTTNSGTFAVTWGTVNSAACIAALDLSP